VFTGYSSLSWGLSIPEDGKVVALDITDEYLDIGKPIWKEAGVERKIDLRIAPAKDSLRRLSFNESATLRLWFLFCTGAQTNPFKAPAKPEAQWGGRNLD